MDDGKTAMADALAPTETAGSAVDRVARPMLGSALSLKEINFVCWGLFLGLLVLPVSLGLLGHVRSGQFVRQAPDRDFTYFYSMGRMFNEYPASQVYDYELQKRTCQEIFPMKTGVYGPNPYAPFIGILFRPFARMAFVPALVLWSSVSFLLYLTGVILCARCFFNDDPLRRSLICCLALSFCPLYWTLGGGQISTIGFFAMALAFRQDERKRPVLSGLALSLCLYKPVLLLLFVPMLVITGRYKTLLGLIGGATALAAAITAIQGPDVWPGYTKLLLSFGAAAGQAHSFKMLWYYMDLASLSALVPGGRSVVGLAATLGFAAGATFLLVRAWWKSRGCGKPATTLVWAATLTWTLILNLYVPMHDSMLIVLSIVATAAALKSLPTESKLRGQFTVLWILILACSWITIPVAQAKGFQVLTLLFASLGILQLHILSKALKTEGALTALPTVGIPLAA